MLGKVLLNTDLALFWALLVFTIGELVNWGRGKRKVKQLSGGRVQFGASWFGIALAGTMAALIPILATGYVRQGSYRMAMIVPACLLIAVAVKVLDLPATIVIGSDGLEQHYWLRSDRRIRWNDIVEVVSSAKAKTVVIKAADGTRIDHMAFRSGRARLLRELKLHCGTELPAGFPAEPLENI